MVGESDQNESGQNFESISRAEKAAQFGTEATNGEGGRRGRRTEKVRTAAAGGLDSAASALHERTDRAASAAHRAADSLSSGADYVRETEWGQIANDLVTVIRNHPGPALFAAVTLGFVLGRVTARN